MKKIILLAATLMLLPAWRPATYPLTKVSVHTLPMHRLVEKCRASALGCQYSFRGEKTCHVVLLKGLPPAKRAQVLAHELDHCKNGIGH